MSKNYTRRDAIKLGLRGIGGVALGGIFFPKNSKADSFGTSDCAGFSSSVNAITDENDPLYIPDAYFIEDEKSDTGFCCADSLYNFVEGIHDGRYPLDKIDLNLENPNFYFKETGVEIYKTVLNYLEKQGCRKPNEFLRVLKNTVYGNTQRAYPKWAENKASALERKARLLRGGVVEFRE